MNTHFCTEKKWSRATLSDSEKKRFFRSTEKVFYADERNCSDHLQKLIRMEGELVGRRKTPFLLKRALKNEFLVNMNFSID